MSTTEKLIQAVRDGEGEQAAALARQALDEGVAATSVVDALTGCIREIGDRFGAGSIFLPELMLAGRAMQGAMNVLEPELVKSSEGVQKRGTIVIGTVKGDVHEIGKDIAITMLKAAGFAVHDLGRDVGSLDFVRRAEEVHADIIGASALMTTTMPAQKEIVDVLEAKGLRAKYHVIIGGAPVTSEWVAEAGADSWGEDAGKAVKILERVMAEKAGKPEG